MVCGMSPELQPAQGEGTLATFTNDARLHWLLTKLLAALWLGLGAAAFFAIPGAPLRVLLLGLGILSFVGALWQAARGLSAGGYKYTLTAQRLDLERGLFGKRRESVELWRVRDVVLDQSLFDRMRGAGTLTIYSTDQVDPVLVVGPIASAQRNYEVLRDATQAARRQGRVMTLQQ
jgi:Bacterial PH domain